MITYRYLVEIHVKRRGIRYREPTACLAPFQLMRHLFRGALEGFGAKNELKTRSYGDLQRIGVIGGGVSRDRLDV